MKELKTVEKKGLPDIKGRWRLTYTKKGNNTVFGGYGLSPYPNPRNGEMIPLINIASKRTMIQYMVDRVQKLLNPNIPQDLVYIEWLIHHPEVQIEGYDQFGEEYKALKKSGTGIKLIALDYQEMNEVDNEEFIDELIGRISLNSGTNAIGLKKIKVILHSIGRSYRDVRYIRDASKEKKFLRRTLKTFVRSSIENAELVYQAIENIDGLKNEYYIAEMLRLKVFTHSGGQFRYQGTPIAVSTAKIAFVWASEPETFLEHKKAMELAQVNELR